MVAEIEERENEKENEREFLDEEKNRISLSVKALLAPVEEAEVAEKTEEVAE